MQTDFLPVHPAQRQAAHAREHIHSYISQKSRARGGLNMALLSTGMWGSALRDFCFITFILQY